MGKSGVGGQVLGAKWKGRRCSTSFSGVGFPRRVRVIFDVLEWTREEGTAGSLDDPGSGANFENRTLVKHRRFCFGREGGAGKGECESGKIGGGGS